MTGPVIETARLTLRPQAMEDFPRWAEMMADPEASKFIGGPQPAEAAWRGFMTMAGAWSLTGVAMFSLIERESGLWLGREGQTYPDDTRLELQHYQDQGLAEVQVIRL